MGSTLATELSLVDFSDGKPSPDKSLSSSPQKHETEGAGAGGMTWNPFGVAHIPVEQQRPLPREPSLNLMLMQPSVPEDTAQPQQAQQVAAEQASEGREEEPNLPALSAMLSPSRPHGGGSWIGRAPPLKSNSSASSVQSTLASLRGPGPLVTVRLEVIDQAPPAAAAAAAASATGATSTQQQQQGAAGREGPAGAEDLRRVSASSTSSFNWAAGSSSGSGGESPPTEEGAATTAPATGISDRMALSAVVYPEPRQAGGGKAAAAAAAQDHAPGWTCKLGLCK